MQAQHLPGLAAHLPSMPLAPHAAAAAAAGLGASGAATAGIMAMAAGRLPSASHLHSAGSSSGSGVKEEKGKGH